MEDILDFEKSDEERTLDYLKSKYLNEEVDEQKENQENRENKDERQKEVEQSINIIKQPIDTEYKILVRKLSSIGQELEMWINVLKKRLTNKK